MQHVEGPVFLRGELLWVGLAVVLLATCMKCNQRFQINFSTYSRTSSSCKRWHCSAPLHNFRLVAQPVNRMCNRMYCNVTGHFQNSHPLPNHLHSHPLPNHPHSRPLIPKHQLRYANATQGVMLRKPANAGRQTNYAHFIVIQDIPVPTVLLVNFPLVM